MRDQEKVTHNIKSLNKRIETLEGNTGSTDSETPDPGKLDKLGRLEACIAKMAHYSGTERIILEFGLKKYDVTKDDMKKYK